jgi:hypothetical protein
MPITDSTGETLDTDEPWFFDRPFTPDELDPLADAVAAWLCSDDLRWLVDRVPGRCAPGGPVEPLEWPDALDDPVGAGSDGRARLAAVVDALREICDWSLPGTAWDYRVGGERPLDAHGASPLPGVSATAVAERAAALGLCSAGRLRTRPRTLVVLGGRRMAPLNRVRAAARAIRSESLAAPRIVLLSASRTLDRDERESPEVRAYAPGARTEADLMLAAAEHVLGADRLRPSGRVRLVEAPTSGDARRASTYDTLELVAADLAIDAAAPLGLVTSPTCRPFQYLEAVRALGLHDELPFELVAHPPAWPAAPSAPPAAPQVYLQEIRSAIQAAGRLADALIADADAIAAARPAALA